MFEMDDLPYKPGKSPAEIEEGARREWQAELKKREAAAKRKATREANAKRRPATTTRKQMAKAGSHPVKPMPKMHTPGDQPRGPDGRWIKVGKAVWSGTKATGRAAKHVLFGTAAIVGGTVAAAQSGHRIVKKSMSKKRSSVKRKRVIRRRRK